MLGEYIPNMSPCPFCGGTPKISTWDNSYDSPVEYAAKIECDNCDLKMKSYGGCPPKDVKKSWGWATSEEATAGFLIRLQETLVKKWNDRRLPNWRVKWKNWDGVEGKMDFPFEDEAVSYYDLVSKNQKLPVPSYWIPAIMF
jgi:hypothetical protein